MFLFVLIASAASGLVLALAYRPDRTPAIYQPVECVEPYDPELDKLTELNRDERISNLDAEIKVYNRMIDQLDDLIDSETDPKKQTILLNRKAATLAKLNRALEKIEKLGY